MDSEGECTDFVGFNVGGIIYKTSISTSMKNCHIGYSRMLNSNIPYIMHLIVQDERAWSREDNARLIEEFRKNAGCCRDSHGNFIIEGDGSLFKHVHAYLEHGVFFSDLDVPTLKSVQKEAARFSLLELQHQIQSIIAMRDHEYEHPQGVGLEIPEFGLHIHVYRWVNGPSVVFANKSSWGNLNVLNVGELCKENATICGGVFAGIIDKEKMIPALESNIPGEIVELNGMRFRSHQLEITKVCTKVVLNEINEGYMGEPWVPM